MRFVRKMRRSVLEEALLGAASGLAASWAMAKAQERLARMGDREIEERERQAQGELEPTTVRIAKSLARDAGTSIPEDRIGVASGAVHYAMGAGFGVLFGVLVRRVPAPALAGGVLWGIAIWLVGDEALAPALGLSRRPWDYPPSMHAKALASHLVYGVVADAGFRVLDAAIR
jgi:predicted cobalt transporter CbtA